MYNGILLNKKCWEKRKRERERERESAMEKERMNYNERSDKRQIDRKGTRREL